MKVKQLSIAAALAMSLSLFTSLPANADQKSASPAATSGVDDFKAAMDKYREDQKSFQNALKIYEEKRRAINKTFKESVEKALSDARLQNAPGQSQLQKRQSMAAKQSAVVAATAARDAAIEALGLPPVAPTPPSRPQKNEKAKKPAPQISQSPNSN